MRVADLIAKLQRLPPDAEVVEIVEARSRPIDVEAILDVPDNDRERVPGAIMPGWVKVDSGMFPPGDRRAVKITDAQGREQVFEAFGEDAGDGLTLYRLDTPRPSGD
jgi:hypothetical protein